MDVDRRIVLGRVAINDRIYSESVVNALGVGGVCVYAVLFFLFWDNSDVDRC